MNSRICYSHKNMEKMLLSGLGTALVTPFKDGKLDLESFRKLVRRQVEAGADFLVPLGSTGETPCLEDDEKMAVAIAAKELAGNLPRSNPILQQAYPGGYVPVFQGCS